MDRPLHKMSYIPMAIRRRTATAFRPSATVPRSKPGHSRTATSDATYAAAPPAVPGCRSAAGAAYSPPPEGRPGWRHCSPSLPHLPGQSKTAMRPHHEGQRGAGGAQWYRHVRAGLFVGETLDAARQDDRRVAEETHRLLAGVVSPKLGRQLFGLSAAFAHRRTERGHLTGREAQQQRRHTGDFVRLSPRRPHRGMTTPGAGGVSRAAPGIAAARPKKRNRGRRWANPRARSSGRAGWRRAAVGGRAPGAFRGCFEPRTPPAGPRCARGIAAARSSRDR
jgi:hypothetical protein